MKFFLSVKLHTGNVDQKMSPEPVLQLLVNCPFKLISLSKHRDFSSLCNNFPNDCVLSHKHQKTIVKLPSCLRRSAFLLEETQ